jgi:hypothetical protein
VGQGALHAVGLKFRWLLISQRDQKSVSVRHRCFPKPVATVLDNGTCAINFAAQIGQMSTLVGLRPTRCIGQILDNRSEEIR